MRISVVIPVYEDRLELASRLSRLKGEAEVIVVDASSIDPVREEDLPEGVRLLRSEVANRAHQQNLGAAAAGGEAILFLHADTELPPGAMAAIEGALADSEVVGGGFERSFDSPSRFLKLTCALATRRSCAWGWFLGDQAIYVRRTIFGETGGFRILKAFEDYDLCRRLKKRGQLRCLAPPVRTSARRFSHDGPVWRSLKDFAMTVVYCVAGTRPFRAIQKGEIKDGPPHHTP